MYLAKNRKHLFEKLELKKKKKFVHFVIKLSFMKKKYHYEPFQKVYVFFWRGKIAWFTTLIETSEKLYITFKIMQWTPFSVDCKILNRFL